YDRSSTSERFQHRIWQVVSQRREYKYIRGAVNHGKRSVVGHRCDMRVWKPFNCRRGPKTETQQEYSARRIHALQRANEVPKSLQVRMESIRDKKDTLCFLRYPQNLPAKTAVSWLKYFKIQAVGDDGTRETRQQRTALYFLSQPPARRNDMRFSCIERRVILLFAAPYVVS